MTAKKSPIPWLQFEKAVAAFVAALDPKAIVKHNFNTPDKDTGHSRQRDVWVETKVLGVSFAYSSNKL